MQGRGSINPSLPSVASNVVMFVDLHKCMCMGVRLKEERK